MAMVIYNLVTGLVAKTVSKAPKGAKVEKGRRGGMFYRNKSGEKIYIDPKGEGKTSSPKTVKKTSSDNSSKKTSDNSSKTSNPKTIKKSGDSDNGNKTKPNHPDAATYSKNVESHVEKVDKTIQDAGAEIKSLMERVPKIQQMQEGPERDQAVKEYQDGVKNITDKTLPSLKKLRTETHNKAFNMADDPNDNATELSNQTIKKLQKAGEEAGVRVNDRGQYDNNVTRQIPKGPARDAFFKHAKDLQEVNYSRRQMESSLDNLDSFIDQVHNLM
jgi:hypothetical protein